MPNLTHNNFSQETLALHAGYTYDSQRTLSVPIYQNTAYSFESLQQAAARFGLQELGNIYSRLTNPTTDILGARLAAIEGGAFGVPTSSGSAAIFYALVNLAQNGDNIAFSNKIYGGTQTLLVHTLKRFGIEARVFDIDDIDNTLEKVIDSKTKAIFFESLSNPQIAIADAEKISGKIQQLFMIKILSQLRIKENFLNLAKNIYKRPTTNILNGETPEALLLRSRIRQGYPLL